MLPSPQSGSSGPLQLACRLSEFQRVNMGMSSSDEELHRRVARRLLALVAKVEPRNAADSRENPMAW